MSVSNSYLPDASPSVAVAGLLLLVFALMPPPLLLRDVVVLLGKVDDEDRNQTLLVPVAGVTEGAAA